MIFALGLLALGSGLTLEGIAVDEVSERDRAVYHVGWLAGRADERALSALLRMVPQIRCPFGRRCICDTGDPRRLLN